MVVQKKLNYIIIFVVLVILISIILLLNAKSIKRSYITAPKVDIYEEVEIYEETSEDRYLELIEAFKNKKVLALTFDDGPSKYTEYLVDELEKRNIPVTFFILGENIEGNEEILKKESKNNEIALHSFSHKLYTKLSNAQIKEDIEKVKEAIFNVTGKNINIIRVPYGSTNSRVSTWLLDNGYTSVKWDIDSKDWHFRNIQKTYNYTMKYMCGNSIILMHDIYKTSVECALKLVDDLKDEYVFVTISDFIYLKNLNK